MSYDRRLMIKQRLGEIPANKTHPRLEMFTSGVPGWYVFAPMVAPGISGTIHFPVKGSELKTGWQQRLEQGGESMTEPDQSEAVEGQCGTCKFAAVFDFADSPSGPEDGVHCTSETQAKMLDEQTGGDCYMQEYKDYGFLSLWRLESLAEPSFKCANWQPR